MKLYTIFFSSCFYFLNSIVISFGQSNCDNLIKESELLYENGYYDSVITYLNNGIRDCKLSRSTREQAYTLMIMAQIEKDYPEEAEKLTLTLLQLNPNYKLERAQTSTVFKNTLEKFQVRPLVIIGLTAGLNFSFAQQLNTYSILDSADYSKPYKTKAGTQFSFMAELEFIKNLSLGAQVYITKQIYQRVITGVNNWQLSFIETSSGNQFPVYLKYYYPYKAVRPYFLFGYYFGTLKESSADVQLDYTAFNGISQTNEQYQQAANGITTTEMRTKKNNGLILGTGIGWQKNNFRLFVDIRYNKSFTEYVNKDNRYSNTDLTFNYYYVDNDIRLSKLEVNVGVNYILMHSIKVKK